MSQIARRRRKGRPSKADLAQRRSSTPNESGYSLRQGQRRRNVRYTFDFDDYLDEEEDTEDEVEENERRRQKKLKQVLKLNQSRARADPPARERHSSDYEVEEEEDEEEEEEESEKREVKKRKINRQEEEEEEDSDDEDDKERKKSASDIGTTQCDDDDQSLEPTPIIDKKSLELILDKLQKKDIYGVYADPVDPEELPDYHETIENPMDFSTVRKKLANGSYTTLEELESDVLLICSNAMQYNSSDTVYYKHARTIQEMGKRKFSKARIKIKRAEKEDPKKTDEKVKPNNNSWKRQVRQPLIRNGPETIGSDFFSGANLASGGASSNEKQSSMDVLSLVDSGERAQDLSYVVRKMSTVEEEDQRATYKNSDHKADRSESSIFTTFESEIKQFVAVGLHAEHAYGRSLARFAATLGPIAWKIASQRIEQTLPEDFKFGRGWVGEYEPLPTPVLLFETYTPKEPPKGSSFVVSKPQSDDVVEKNETLFKAPLAAKEQQGNRPVRDGNRAFVFPSSIGEVSEGSPSFVNMSQQEFRNPSYVKLQNKVHRQVELNLPPPVEQTSSGSGRGLENRSNGNSDTVTSYRNMAPTNYKHQMAATNGIFPGGLSTSKVSTENKRFDLSTDPSNQTSRASAKARKQSQSHSERTQHKTNAPPDVSLTQSGSGRREDASAAAARAWMSIGGGGNHNNNQTFQNPKSSQISVESLYNPSREQVLHHQQGYKHRGPEGTQFHNPQKNGLPFQTFVHQQPVHHGGYHQPMGFPQMTPTTDFTRFHVQSPWRGDISPHVQLKQRQEHHNFPPDLNIGVHSPDSPAKQPDLALQL